MEYNKEEIIKLERWIDEYIKNKEEKYKDISMVLRKIEHINRTVDIAKKVDPTNDLLRVAMKFHDIGRFEQYERIESFDDKVLSHYILGKEIIDNYIEEGVLNKSKELDLIIQVIKLHFGIEYIPYNVKLEDKTLKIIDMAAKIDALDNGCVGALTYIEDEILNDSKNYIKYNPNLDMKKVSPYVLKKYLNGESFDKIKYCKTYAEYMLFATSLAIKSLKSPLRKVAKEIMSKGVGKYKNSILGYEDLIKNYVDEKISGKCIKVLENYYNNYKIIK